MPLLTDPPIRPIRISTANPDAPKPKSKSAGKKIWPKKKIDEGDLIYGKRIDSLRKQGKDHNDLEILNAALDMINGLIPIAEKSYHEYPIHLNAAALNHLLNQLRETTNDIRNLEDFGKRSVLITDFLGGEYKRILKEAMTDLFSIEHQVHNKSAKPEHFEGFRKNMARRFFNSETNARKRVEELLQIRN